jgi:polar amino acid transport system ATP-binding protein
MAPTRTYGFLRLHGNDNFLDRPGIFRFVNREVSTNAPISVKDLHKSFNHLSVLKGIDLEIQSGQLTVLIGPSGCGKSTFLRCLNGLEVADKGVISIGGITLDRTRHIHEDKRKLATEIHQLRANVGMVFQSFNLFPHLTVLENITKAPIVVRKQSQDKAETTARELLKKVGLTTHEKHYPLQLSGGQQQRAAIARALAMNPSVMLYDEPTSALDPALVDEVLQVMKQLDAEGMTQIVVTHEMRFARDAADTVVFFENGLVAESGSTEEIFTKPKNERTRRFLKKFL